MVDSFAGADDDILGVTQPSVNSGVVPGGQSLSGTAATLNQNTTTSTAGVVLNPAAVTTQTVVLNSAESKNLNKKRSRKEW